jgi:hypothetical protein
MWNLKLALVQIINFNAILEIILHIVPKYLIV